jgi:4-hydroxy-tetrahydrodipicolinate synthase
MALPRFGTVLTAMVTPFSPDGSVNFDVASQIAKFIVEQGCDGLVIAGSTGEGSALSDEEKMDLFYCVAQAVNVPVLAGTTSSNTAESVALTSRVAATGVAGVLVTTPAYARPSQAGMTAHFSAIANSTKLPVMLYDIPIRTGRKIKSETAINLVRNLVNVIAMKDASGDLVQAAHTKAVLGEELDLYSGDDSVVLPFMAIGAVGLVSVAAHWAAPEFSALVRCVEKGDWEKAREFNERLAPSCEWESGEMYPNPIPAKSALRALGFAVGQCRPPLGPGDATCDAEAAEIVASLQASRG